MYLTLHSGGLKDGDALETPDVLWIVVPSNVPK